MDDLCKKIVLKIMPIENNLLHSFNRYDLKDKMKDI